MSEFLYNIWSKFLTYFGQIKVLTFHHLSILAYDPDPFVVTGKDIVEIMELVQPGDVVLRGFNKYLDGRFIPDERGYSHAGLYVGNNEVIHSASPCVGTIHLIDFCEADRIMVLRPKEGAVEAIATARRKLGVPYDFNYETDIGKLYCFELISVCYPQAEMKTHQVKQMLGLVKRDCYIAKSIYENPFFKEIYERNEKGTRKCV